MQWSDHIGARSKILSLTDAHDDAHAENDTGSRTERRGSDVGVSVQSVSSLGNVAIVDATVAEDRCARIVAQLSVLPVQESLLAV
jgi:hypothetical protein